MVIAWREKTRAFAIHFLVTLTLTASAAALAVNSSVTRKWTANALVFSR